jgi:hypothetical protein
MLEKGLIPATIHYNKPLPEFDLSSSKLTIPVETKPWPATPLRRISVGSTVFIKVFTVLTYYRSIHLDSEGPMPTLCLMMHNPIWHPETYKEQAFVQRYNHCQI